VIIKYVTTGNIDPNHKKAERPIKLTSREERKTVSTVLQNPRITTKILCKIQVVTTYTRSVYMEELLIENH